MKDKLREIDEFFDNLTIEEYEKMALECGMDKESPGRIILGDPSYAILELLPDHMTRAEIIRIITTYGLQEEVSGEEFEIICNFVKALGEL